VSAAANRACGIPVAALAASVGLAVSAGAVHDGAAPWEAALVRLQVRLERDWLDAPTREELSTAGLTAEILRQASRDGRILLLPGGVALGAGAPQAAHERLATLPARWSTSQARRSLGTSRRVVVPLLEHLDSLGVTRRVDTVLRELNALST
jgi:selenocysteine-specific elongation factor